MVRRRASGDHRRDARRRARLDPRSRARASERMSRDPTAAALELARAHDRRRENADVDAILKLLQAHGIECFELRREAAHNRKLGYHRAVGPDGMSDIHFVWRGGVVYEGTDWRIVVYYTRGTAGWIEVKRPKATTARGRKLTQAAFRDRIIRAGG